MFFIVLLCLCLALMDSEFAGAGAGVEKRGQELEMFLFPEWLTNQSDRRNLPRIWEDPRLKGKLYF